MTKRLGGNIVLFLAEQSTTFRFRSLFTSLFVEAYSHGEAAAADAPLHTAFSAHFELFFLRGGCGNRLLARSRHDLSSE